MLYEPQGNDEMIFELSCPNGESVFMKLPALSKDDTLRIVFVDAVAFTAVWGGDHSSGNPDSWRASKNFVRAEKCIKASRDFPIPPAQVGGQLDGKFKFVDGITRTIWLLANEVAYFPLICSAQSLEELEELAGADISDSDLQHRLFPARGVGSPHPKL